MTNMPFAIAARCVRAWTSLYTYGLPAGDRSDRRREIDSDITEFQRDVGDAGAGAALHLLWRLVTGMTADVLWRIEVMSLMTLKALAAVALAICVLGAYMFYTVAKADLLPVPADPRPFVAAPAPAQPKTP
jgi:hypothetical protein